jgi:hypothetical protein
MQIKLTSRQEAGLQGVLQAATRTAFYRDKLQRVQSSPANSLDLLPFVTLAEFDENRASFRDPRFARRQLAQFRYPLETRAKVLMLVDGFKRNGITQRVFGHKTDTLAGPVQVLREMAPLAGVQRYPVVAFTGVRYGALSQADRDVFWKSYRVPVFEQFLGPQNELVAEECEAHDGLHVNEEETIIELRSGELVFTPLLKLEYPVLRIATGLTAKLDHSLCPCNRAGLRLMEVAPLMKALHASAR